MPVRMIVTTLALSAVMAAPTCGDEPWRALVIAHRGASGYLPEHTLAAYALACGQGADYVEPDVVLTRDGAAICLHDVTLERVTDVERVFPGRQRDDGRWYALDFDLDEIRRLRIDASTRMKADEAPAFGSGYAIPTLAEMLAQVRLYNRRSGRRVGVVPEAKAPGFHRAAGQSLERELLRVLSAYGYDDADDRCIVQCFEPDALRRMRSELGCRLPLMLLVGGPEDLERVGGVDGAAQVADFLGPSRKLVSESDGRLVRAAQARGMRVVPWTFDADRDALAHFFREYRVDGLFGDYPDVAVAVRDRASTP